jgi:serine/threonine protein kinase
VRERERIKGSFVVYTGEEIGTDRRVVVTAKAAVGISDGDAARFKDRAAAAATLDHVNCRAIADFGHTVEGFLYLVEEGMPWPSLEQELQQKGRLPISVALELTNQLLDGLDYLHGQGVTHGGLAATSIQLAHGEDGSYRIVIPLTDLVCQVVDPDGGAEERRHYAPPSGTTGPAGDLYVAALLLTEMLSGALPDDQISLDNVELEGEEMEVLRTVLRKGLRRGGTRGYDSAWELRRDLEQLTGHARFGRYHLLHRLAQGGMGEIYLARAEGIKGIDIDRFCVIKTIRTSLAEDSQFVERFLAEARVLASLSHGNIVPVYDVGRVGSTFYIAMEYVSGHDLSEILSRAAKIGKRLPVPLALFIVKELANGLAYAHRAEGGLVHRDVSPHNVLVSYDGAVRLIDFGLVQGAKGVPVTEEGVVMGKLCYLSPEQALAEPLDRRTDIYAAGLVLFELLTGEPFFNQESVEGVMTQVASPQLVPPSSRAAGIPEEVDRICLRAMAPKRDDRYPSAGPLRDDLAAALARIAPRTNPEQVGAFVRELFPDEQREKERVLSDLSITLPPKEPTGDQEAGGEPGIRKRESEAISLLGHTPTPIHLASTAPAEFVAHIADEAAASGRHNVAGTITTGPGLQAVVTDQIQLQQELEMHRSRGRRGLVVILAVTLAVAAGVGIGILVSQNARQEPDERKAASAKNLATVIEATGNGQRRLGEAEVPALPDATVAPAAPANVANVANVKRRSIRRGHTVRRVDPTTEASQDACMLYLKGGPRGGVVRVDGKIRGRLPLGRPLQVRPGSIVVISQRGKEPFRTKIRCKPGDKLRLRLSVE